MENIMEAIEAKMKDMKLTITLRERKIEEQNRIIETLKNELEQKCNNRG